MADALARFAGVDDVVFVPDDPAALDAALLEGRSLAECAPQSPVRAAVRGLAARVAGVAVPHRPTGPPAAAPLTPPPGRQLLKSRESPPTV